MKTDVVQEGATVLREHAQPVSPKDIGTKAFSALVNKMKDTLAREEFGVAIAAPQVGASLRMFVIAGKAFESDEETKGFDEESEEEHEIPDDMVFINPTITRLSKKQKEMSEGCLSVRGKYGSVMRHEKASIEALDEQGHPFTYHASGLIAHIFQHEVDHLDGILYIDKAIKLEEDDSLDGARQKLKDKHGI